MRPSSSYLRGRGEKNEANIKLSQGEGRTKQAWSIKDNLLHGIRTLFSCGTHIE